MGALARSSGEPRRRRSARAAARLPRPGRGAWAPVATFLLAGMVLLGPGCLEYSPHALPLDASERDLHAAAKQRLEATPRPPALRFAVVGDTQLRFDEARAAVDALNGIAGISFVVQLGDFTHVGVLREFQLMLDEFRRLSVPFFVVIGNHDQLGNGRAIFERMFGPVNDGFTFGGARFLLLDTNSRDAGFDGSVPDLSWMRERLVGAGAEGCNTQVNAAFGAEEGSEVPVVLFAHVAPDTEEFDASLTHEYWELVHGGGVRLSFHGHEHAFRSGLHDGVPFFVSAGLEDRVLLVASQRADGGFDVERVPF